MASGLVHTLHSDGSWKNSVEGDGELLPGTFDTKEDAVAAGRVEAKRRKTEHVTHDKDGSISYSSDRADRPG